MLGFVGSLRSHRIQGLNAGRFGRPRRALAALACVLLTGLTAARAGVVLEDVTAPEWDVSQWLNGDPGKLSDHRGRVVLIQFFQLWCPGCSSFSVPLFGRWEERYGNRDDVLLVSIHSVFEGHAVQTPQRLQDYVRQRGLRHPVGIDAYSPRDPLTPLTMKHYEVNGSPSVVVIDKEGKIRFSHLGRFDPAVVESFIDRLLKERGAVPAAAKPAPATQPGTPISPPAPGRRR